GARPVPGQPREVMPTRGGRRVARFVVVAAGTFVTGFFAGGTCRVTSLRPVDDYGARVDVPDPAFQRYDRHAVFAILTQGVTARGTAFCGFATDPDYSGGIEAVAFAGDDRVRLVAAAG